MKTILFNLVPAMALILALTGCGRSELNYPCNFYYAPSQDNGSKCTSCFATAEAELSFMEKYLGFWARNNPVTKKAVIDAEFGPNPGSDLYPLFIQSLALSPSFPKGWCGK